MSNALFAFDDRDAGQRAADRLIVQGVPPSAVHVHVHEPYEESFSRKADEQISGGLVSNVLDLFQGIFDFGSSPHDAAAFEETVRRGGVVVSVDADSDDERSTVDEIMLAAGCDQHTDWSQAPAR
ncbi:hypothetical protein [Piscinibacter sp. HJYY11]|uniref:hypothetical protein n=1 Tax=Piscinibacter sp. HJYY11 TaxID=2801333 RepID=UPI00191D1DBA|nr:hypothetical protein [Piscinibacter sp. HJYY11]MBL0728415.1 hypothetical protein [Piscinibacter sp. HJYY11]